jgi:hypothetical protein
VRAASGPATARALYIWGIASAILKEHYLLSALQSVGYAVKKFLVKVTLALPSFYGAHSVRDDNLWRQ